MSPHKVETLPSLSALPLYDISENGFLPAQPPLLRLSHAMYRPWESIVQDLPKLFQDRVLRNHIDALPVLDTSHFHDLREWRRAYSLLAVLAQAYIWQGPEPSERLPPAITVPFLKTAAHLETLPCPSYAALNLWNWTPSGEGVDLCQPDNMRALLTLTGSDDESWFFTVSNAMEARAGPIIKSSLVAFRAVDEDNADTVIASLKYFRERIRDLGILLERMDEGCRPDFFYHKIRPNLAGGVNMAAAGLPNGVFYDEGDGKGSWRKYRGGSNGQSSLLQFFDAVLGVNHDRCDGFHAEMRDYMPGPHRRFLDDVEAVANLQSYVESNRANEELCKTFNEAVAALSGFRDKHIALVTRYIIIPSRKKQPAESARERNLATSSTSIVGGKANTEDLVGTGGTTLIPFLRTSRDETSEAAITR